MQALQETKKTVTARRKKETYATAESLTPVLWAVNEAQAMLREPTQLEMKKTLPEEIVGVIGAALGLPVSYSLIAALGTPGLSAAGITSAFAAAGFGLGMLPGAFLLILGPALLLGGAGYVYAKRNNKKNLRQAKLELIGKIQSLRAVMNQMRSEGRGGENVEVWEGVLSQMEYELKKEIAGK